MIKFSIETTNEFRGTKRREVEADYLQYEGDNQVIAFYAVEETKKRFVCLFRLADVDAIAVVSPEAAR